MPDALGPCDHQPMARTVLIVDDHAPFRALARALFVIGEGEQDRLLGPGAAGLVRARPETGETARATATVASRVNGE